MLQRSETGGDDAWPALGLRTGGLEAFCPIASQRRERHLQPFRPGFMFSWPAQIAIRVQKRVVKDLFPHL
jgi:hypothetical protein